MSKRVADTRDNTKVGTTKRTNYGMYYTSPLDLRNYNLDTESKAYLWCDSSMPNNISTKIASGYTPVEDNNGLKNKFTAFKNDLTPYVTHKELLLMQIDKQSAEQEAKYNSSLAQVPIDRLKGRGVYDSDKMGSLKEKYYLLG